MNSMSDMRRVYHVYVHMAYFNKINGLLKKFFYNPW